MALFQFSISAQVVIKEQNSDKDVVFNYAVVENVPIAAGCDTLGTPTNEELKLCFQQYVVQHVASEYQFPDDARQNKVAAKIYVNFVIERNGDISNIEVIRGAEREYRRGSKKQKKLPWRWTKRP